MSKFVVWLSNSDYSNSANLTARTEDPVALSVDSQKVNGFEGGTAASSTRVNSMLRQSSLITVALMKALETAHQESNDFDFKTNVQDIDEWLRNLSLFQLPRFLSPGSNSLDYNGSAFYSSVNANLGLEQEPWNKAYISSLEGNGYNAVKYTGNFIANASLVSGIQVKSDSNAVIKFYGFLPVAKSSIEIVSTNNRMPIADFVGFLTSQIGYEPTSSNDMLCRFPCSGSITYTDVNDVAKYCMILAVEKERGTGTNSFVFECIQDGNIVNVSVETGIYGTGYLHGFCSVLVMRYGSYN